MIYLYEVGVNMCKNLIIIFLLMMGFSRELSASQASSRVRRSPLFRQFSGPVYVPKARNMLQPAFSRLIFRPLVLRQVPALDLTSSFLIGLIQGTIGVSAYCGVNFLMYRLEALAGITTTAKIVPLMRIFISLMASFAANIIVACWADENNIDMRGDTAGHIGWALPYLVVGGHGLMGLMRDMKASIK